MTPLDRIKCVVEGRRPDRPPFSFWQHFPPDQVHGQAAVQAHLEHFFTYQPDFMKVMNDNPYPHEAIVRGVANLATLRPLHGDEAGFARQLQLLADLRAQLGQDVLMITTIFNAWTVLRHLVQPPTEHLPPEMDATADAPSRAIKAMYAQDPLATDGAIRRIGTSLARFARRCIEAGADGIFLSVRDDWVRSPGQTVDDVYDQVVRPADLEILRSAATGRFNMLHVCGQAIDFRSFAEYPVHAINWADRSAGPSIADVKPWLKPAICGGIDNLRTLPTGSVKNVEDEILNALNQAGLRPMIVAPGCTYDPRRVPTANLSAIGHAVQRWHYGG